MKNTWMLAILAIMIATSAFAPGLAAASPAYGAAGAAAVADSELTLGAMLTFALQDEYLARGEYQKIMAKFVKLGVCLAQLIVPLICKKPHQDWHY